jgi:proteasome lid subunit RPN8/RPN11
VIAALLLDPEVEALLGRAALAARPGEYAAALLGRVTTTTAVATAVLRLRNCDTRAGRFAVPDRELQRARRVAAERGCELVALAHSHPHSPPAPSRRDAAAIAVAAHPWLIVGFDGGDHALLAAFRAGGGEPLPVQVRAAGWRGGR